MVILVGGTALELLMPGSARALTWVCVMGLMAIFGVVVGHGITHRWLGLLIDTEHKVSLSRLQMILWTILILSGFLTVVAANIDSGLVEPLRVAIPPELWVLMGISTSSMVGSPILQRAKQSRMVSDEEKQRTIDQLAQRSVDPSRVSFRGQVVVNHSLDAASIADIFQGSETGTVGLVDIGQVQMFFFTLVLVFAYGTALAGLFSTGEPIRALPVVDTGMLALLSISHAGFLVNKAIP